MQKLDAMKRYLKQQLININDPFYDSMENRINFLAESRRLPNLKALVNQSLSMKTLNAVNNETELGKNNLKEVDFDNDELKITMKKIEHPNIIDPTSLLQLNIMKRGKQRQMDQKMKEKLVVASKVDDKNKLKESIIQYKKLLDERYNQDEEMLGYFKHKVKKFNQVQFLRASKITDLIKESKI